MGVRPLIPTLIPTDRNLVFTTLSMPLGVYFDMNVFMETTIKQG